MGWLNTIRRVRWSWAIAALMCLAIGFVVFTNASTQSCVDGEECWPTMQDRLGQGLIAAATIAAVGWCAWRALRHDPGVESDSIDADGTDPNDADPRDTDPNDAGPHPTD